MQFGLFEDRPQGFTTLDELVARLTVGGQLSPSRVNVLALNLALDARFSGQ